MGVSWRTPGYMIREELQREKMRIRAGRRAWGFEEKLAKGRGSGKEVLGGDKGKGKEGSGFIGAGGRKAGVF